MLDHLLENDIKKWAEDYLATLVERLAGAQSARWHTRAVRRPSSDQAPLALR